MKSLLIALVILFAIPQQTFASTCPPPPVPLRQLVQQAEYVVIGTIRSTEEVIVFNYKGLKVTMEVQQVLQGHIGTKTISLFLDPWMELRMGQLPHAAEQMIVFINFSEEEQIYVPSSYKSSYKVLDKQGITAYRQRVKEIQAINTLKDEKRRDQLTVDWLINCAENPYTHWEGAYELAPYSGFMRYYDEELEDYVTRITLTEPQKQRLRKLILEQTEIQQVDILLIDTISGWQDPEIHQLLVNFLKSIDPQLLWQQNYLLHRLAATSQREDLSETLEKLNTLEYNDDYQEQANAIAVEFVGLL